MANALATSSRVASYPARGDIQSMGAEGAENRALVYASADAVARSLMHFDQNRPQLSYQFADGRRPKQKRYEGMK